MYKFGYQPDASKLWLIVNKELCQDAVTMFTDPKIKVRSAGKRRLGEVIGSTSYKEDFINEKIDVRVKKRQLLFFSFYIYNLHFFKQKTYSHQVLIYLNIPGIPVRKPLQNRQIVS